ncbi:MAG: BMP family ABC transporter substrate-binding protein [Clostridia bacterium]|nr:BMP family ABC transporter substrate-binding protein [Clostridia bacterium]
MKKFASLLLALCMLMGMFAVANAEGVAADQIKIGIICIGDENEGYTANHLNGLYAACEALGISKDQVIVKPNVRDDTDDAEVAAVDLAEAGCDIIFANSFGHEPYLFLVASNSDYADIEFCHATGTQAKDYGLDNVHNYFTAIYEARYVSGVVAGMKLNQMIEEGKITAEQAKIGYVGAYPFEEVKSGYTAFFLGARSVCPSATMEVKFTNSWGDMALEKEAAAALIAKDCVLISQHADTTGAPSACQEAGVPCVGYNISMINAAPDQALVSAACNWSAYYRYAISNVLAGTSFAPDWCYGYADDAVYLTELNEKVVAPGTAEKVAEVEAQLKAGTLHVFDTSTFTVNGETLTSWTTCYGLEGIEMIYDGYFHESEVRSAPYFGIDIDGITLVE